MVARVVNAIRERGGFDRTVFGLVRNADAELGHFENYRQRAEELEKRRKPRPVNTVHARGSMKWRAEQEKQKKEV
jgi:hypothetical protein